jgi:tetratricopeptide (TPR) repeat protein
MSSNPEATKKKNMEAIFLLRQGRISEAISTFKDALRTIKAGLPEKAESMINFGDEEPTSASTSSPAVRSVSIVDNEDATARLLADTNDLFDFYPRAFEILTPTCYSHHKRCLVVMLYNMAVAFDSSAISTGDPSASVANMESALQLYSSALDVARTNWDQDDVAAMRCVLLAILNNLGRLQSLSLDFQQTRCCLTMAVDLLSWADVPQLINEEDYRPLAMSVGPFYVLNQKLLTVAPSA